MSRTLDICGEVCPYNLTLTQKEFKKLDVGEQIDILTDYPLTLETIPRWAEKAGHKVVGIKQVGDSLWQLSLIKTS